jgi:hypothetical protein
MGSNRCVLVWVRLRVVSFSKFGEVLVEDAIVVAEILLWRCRRISWSKPQTDFWLFDFNGRKLDKDGPAV